MTRTPTYQERIELGYGTGNEKRDMEGAIVTLARRDDPDISVSQRIYGPDVLTALAALLDRHDPRVWRLVSYSTVRTILADVRGRKLSNFRHDPEQDILAKAGRKQCP